MIDHQRPRKFPRFLEQNTDINWQGLRDAPVFWNTDLMKHTVWSDAGTIDVPQMLKKLHCIGFRGEPVPPLVRFSRVWMDWMRPTAWRS